MWYGIHHKIRYLHETLEIFTCLILKLFHHKKNKRRQETYNKQKLNADGELGNHAHATK